MNIRLDPSMVDWLKRPQTAGRKMLAVFLTEDEAATGHPLRQFVRSLVQPGVAEAAMQAAVASKFNFDLNDALEIEGHLPLRKELLTAAHDSLSRLATADPSNAGWQHDLAGSFQRMAVMAARAGNRAEAAEYFAGCRSTLKGMQARGMYLDQAVASLLAQLDQSSIQNYAPLITSAANILQQMEQAGQANLVAPLRQQLQAKLPSARKKWWKLW
jgi:hypothetical protein